MSLSAGPVWPAVLDGHLVRIEAEVMRIVGAHRCRRVAVSIGVGPVLVVTVWPRRGVDLVDEVAEAVAPIVADVGAVPVVVAVVGSAHTA